MLYAKCFFLPLDCKNNFQKIYTDIIQGHFFNIQSNQAIMDEISIAFCILHFGYKEQVDVLCSCLKVHYYDSVQLFLSITATNFNYLKVMSVSLMYLK